MGFLYDSTYSTSYHSMDSLASLIKYICLKYLSLAYKKSILGKCFLVNDLFKKETKMLTNITMH